MYGRVCLSVCVGVCFCARRVTMFAAQANIKNPAVQLAVSTVCQTGGSANRLFSQTQLGVSLCSRAAGCRVHLLSCDRLPLCICTSQGREASEYLLCRPRRASLSVNVCYTRIRAAGFSCLSLARQHHYSHHLHTYGWGVWRRVSRHCWQQHAPVLQCTCVHVGSCSSHPY